MTLTLPKLRLANPVLAKDLRTRMRGSKAFIIMGVYVGLIAVMMGLSYMTWWVGNRSGMTPYLISSNMGHHLYLLLFHTQTALVCLITPALTAGTITLEREQRTYELLAATRIGPRTIVMGKLLSGWLFVVMLLLSSLPVAALCLMLGGVSLGEIFASFLMLCAFAFFFGSIGIFFSSLSGRSTVAVMLTYGAVFGYLIVTVVLQGVVNMGQVWGTAGALNPFVFVQYSTQKLSVFSVEVPGFLPPLVGLGAMSGLLVNCAVMRLPNFFESRSGLIKAMLAVLVPVGVLVFLGEDLTGGFMLSLIHI